MPILLTLLLACTPEEEAAIECGDPADHQGGVFYWVDFAERIDGVSVGFDLDTHDTDDNDAEGCDQADLVSPDGLAGIDNAFSAMIPALEATEAAAIDGLIQDAINTGELLLMYDVQRLDSLTDDECVDMDFFRASGEPMIGSEGWIVPSQTFDLQTDADVSRVEGASIVDGALEAGPFTFELPISILDADLDLTLHGAQIHLEFDETGAAVGYIGGGISVDSLVTQIVELDNVRDDMKELASGLVLALADMHPDETGACTELSVVLEFASTPAFTFED